MADMELTKGETYDVKQELKTGDFHHSAGAFLAPHGPYILHDLDEQTGTVELKNKFNNSVNMTIADFRKNFDKVCNT